MVTHNTVHATPHLDAPASRSRTRRLLTVAALSGPLFFVSPLIQALAREGFDIRVHPLSQLATGGAGWIQQVTFLLAGLGVVALAVAHRRIITRGPDRGSRRSSSATATDRASRADVLAPPTLTPWRSVNSRLRAPAGLQVTLFQELGFRRSGGVRGRLAGAAARARRGFR